MESLIDRIIQNVLKFFGTYSDPVELWNIADREAKQVLYVRDDY